jgi:hypothetical protein
LVRWSRDDRGRFTTTSFAFSRFGPLRRAIRPVQSGAFSRPGAVCVTQAMRLSAVLRGSKARPTTYRVPPAMVLSEWISSATPSCPSARTGKRRIRPSSVVA